MGLVAATIILDSQCRPVVPCFWQNTDVPSLKWMFERVADGGCFIFIGLKNLN